MLSFTRVASTPIQAGHGFCYLGHQTHYARYCRNWSKLWVPIYGHSHSQLILMSNGNLRLSVAIELVRNFTKEDPAIANSFFQQYLLAMLGDVFYVLTDTDHKSGKSCGMARNHRKV